LAGKGSFCCASTISKKGFERIILLSDLKYAVLAHILKYSDVGFSSPRRKTFMLKQATRRPILPLVSNPCAPYSAQGTEDSILIWHFNESVKCFPNAFQTMISVVDWSSDGTILIAGSMTGEVLAWRFATGALILANRHAHSYAPIAGLSWSPGGDYLVALTMARTIQIWQVATRKCLAVLPCQGRTTLMTWRPDGNGFWTNDGVVWTESAGGRS